MRFRKQSLIGVFAGLLFLSAAYFGLAIEQVVLGRPSDSSSLLVTSSSILSILGVTVIAVTVWRGIARLFLVKTNALAALPLGDFLRDVPFWQWVLHIDKEGKDRDA